MRDGAWRRARLILYDWRHFGERRHGAGALGRMDADAGDRPHADHDRSESERGGMQSEMRGDKADRDSRQAEEQITHGENRPAI